MAKPKNQKSSEEDIKREERKVTRCVVSKPLFNTNLKSTLDFEWPEYTSEKARIRENSMRCADMSFIEAMTGRVRDKEDLVEELQTPTTFRVGDEFKVRLRNIDGIIAGLDLGSIQTKEAVVCKNNLGRYKNPNPSIFNKEFTARVIDSNKKQVTVDILQPLFDEWVNKVVKDPSVQCHKSFPQVVTVENLQLMNSGFLGRAHIPFMEELFGDPYYVDAFIPGSHIVLNIENNFEQWIGKSVTTFVSNFVTKPGSLTEKSLVCSRKNYLTYLGDLNKISMFNACCELNDVWNDITRTAYPGKVTGVINSSKKCGVFVEIPQLYITGIVNMKPEDIVKYNPGQNVFVNIIDFEDMSYYDEVSKQRVHLEPYHFENDVLKKCILKPVLKLA